MNDLKRKIWRTLLVWASISLIMQFGAYAYLNDKVKTVMVPPDLKPITQRLSADIPGVDLTNIQLSYAKDYLAYTEHGVLKVYNLKQKKVVFSKAPLAGSDKNMGVLNYEWLPDRNTLIYFFARKNPNPVVTTVVQPSGGSSATESVTKNPPSASTPASNSAPASGKSSLQSGSSAIGAPTSSLPRTEDPNQDQKLKQNPAPTPAPVPAQPKVEIRKSNPQLTDLYTLEFPESDNQVEKPDDRFNQTLTNFPAGGTISQMLFSTFTNLMYLTIKSGNTTQLLQIDVMKKVETISRSGEVILDAAASERYGTLYVELKSVGKKQIVAVDGYKRKVVSNDQNMEILGNRAGVLYLGEVQNGILTKVLTLKESADQKENPATQTEWQGSLAFKGDAVQIGAENQVILYNRRIANIIANGKDRTVELDGDDSYISVDGAELVELTRQGETTHVELRPLE
ncbi:MAG: hypothetical protein QMC95_12825 [Desulfitobacteriaceae bacterium]|nr:hypothetical protein [Desulfitobacteriaceae bacterium]MDI6915082.1 hypothetical protein [Desulfitobacteriaceae bacterium]